MAHDLIDTTEMYLKTVFELLELGVTPMRARIAERLGQSGPTVSQTVARMERDGLLFLDDERVIHLSIEGERIATEVMRKHRLAERLLLDVLGLDYSKVHQEACRWEHVMSLEVEKKIAALIEAPFDDPYGNPIPGLDALGLEGKAFASSVAGATEGAAALNREGVRLVDLKVSESAAEVRVASIGEVIQSDPDFLNELAGHGVVPGALVAVESDADSLVLRGSSGEPVTLSPVDAGHIRVCATPAP